MNEYATKPQVNSKWNAGDYEGALNTSKNGRLWSWIFFATGVAIVIIIWLLTMLGVIAGLSFGNF